jgi:DNA polymerase III subunit delta
MARPKDKEPDHHQRLSQFADAKVSGPPLPIYVLRGTDPFLLDRGRTAVRERTIGQADAGLALLEMNGPDAQLADILDALRTLPFLAPHRLVIIREADAFLDEHTRDALLKYLLAPSSTGSLCLQADSWNDFPGTVYRL